MILWYLTGVFNGATQVSAPIFTGGGSAVSASNESQLRLKKSKVKDGVKSLIYSEQQTKLTALNNDQVEPLEVYDAGKAWLEAQKSIRKASSSALSFEIEKARQQQAALLLFIQEQRLIQEQNQLTILLSI